MGKKHKYKGRINVPALLDAIDTYPMEQLMPAAKVVCGGDYAVYNYNKKKMKAFYHNDELVRKALRRCVAFHAFDHIETLARMLEIDSIENNNPDGDDNPCGD